ncbi:gamma-glutamyl-gamma-aminobutyrate hydrolase family protein [Enterococcus sp. 669A]|uniref:Gamma-glutamyl-gamma-aminobutyrate hydrolase family protein n=1 Tax=Candidatus Enterococcus moelleringii TaxID=2815325 RepID=A0ABS3LGV8_9ENTE|nr:gamma-glutamyl-gamma-aminobutyrate hydrolase family protein [Enterococcus sp. 669A]MBO1308874.1 gamma-glutamyl-gamma-aminobutyrate hydrolase family protein [Enterococcus sp. 669A]
MKPIIGIMPLYDRKKESIWMLPGYVGLIEANGGIPMILPLTDNFDTLDYFLETCQGFLFTGGQDISPELYGAEKLVVCGETHQVRDTMEIYCMEKALEEDTPILGICRGAQLLNVVSGGTLYQDLPTERPTETNHQMKPPYDKGQHEVQLVEGTMLADILDQSSLSVNSYHHQGIKDVGEKLTVTAISEDGLVEGIYLDENQFVLGVQWHPEFFASDTRENQRLIQMFLAHCY